MSSPKMIGPATQRALCALLIVASLLGLAACSTLPPGPRDMQDERTGVTITVAGAPIELAGEPGHSAHDFLTLVAIQQDNDGKYTALLLLYRWSAYYDPASSSPAAGAGDLAIGIDGHSIELQPLPRLPAGLPESKDLFLPDKAEPALRAYVTDLDTIRLIAASHELTVRVPGESPDDSYTVWKDGRPAFEQFVKHLSGP